jgi:hypothetical protein
MVDAHLDQDGWEWHYDTATPATLTKVVWVSGSTEVNIPAKLDGSTSLMSIGASCFNDVEGHKITKVLSMPATVTTINILAFYGCNLLTSVIIGSGVTTIKDAAFQSCTSLISITIPPSVTSVLANAFATCTSLTSITIPASVTTLGNGVFEGCTSLISVTIINGRTAVPIRTFYSCSSLTSITIPASVTSIGASAFQLCTALTSITFLSHDVPTVANGWITSCAAGILGHAYASSHFPTPGNYFPAAEPDVADRLTMGDYIPEYNPMTITLTKTITPVIGVTSENSSFAMKL